MFRKKSSFKEPYIPLIENPLLYSRTTGNLANQWFVNTTEGSLAYMHLAVSDMNICIWMYICMHTYVHIYIYVNLYLYVNKVLPVYAIKLSFSFFPSFFRLVGLIHAVP